MSRLRVDAQPKWRKPDWAKYNDAPAHFRPGQMGAQLDHRKMMMTIKRHDHSMSPTTCRTHG